VRLAAAAEFFCCRERERRFAKMQLASAPAADWAVLLPPPACGSFFAPPQKFAPSSSVFSLCHFAACTRAAAFLRITACSSAHLLSAVAIICRRGRRRHRRRRCIHFANSPRCQMCCAALSRNHRCARGNRHAAPLPLYAMLLLLPF